MCHWHPGWGGQIQIIGTFPQATSLHETDTNSYPANDTIGSSKVALSGSVHQTVRIAVEVVKRHAANTLQTCTLEIPERQDDTKKWARGL